MEDYRTIAGRSTAEVEEKHSRFIALAAFADSEEKALAVLEEVRAAHRTARHNVYAYVLRQAVLDAIRHAGLTDCIVVVTRYFGGILLGTGGLVRAYTASAAAVLAAAKVVTVRACVRLTVSVDYALYERAVQLLQGAGGRLDEPVFADRVTLTALLPAGAEEPLLPAFAQLSRGAAAPQITPPFYAPL